MKRKALIRLLGPSCYDSEFITRVKYPIIVEAEIGDIIEEYAEISADVLDKFAPMGSPRHFGLTWFNPLKIFGVVVRDRKVSWEPYEPSPFDSWNKLKESREAGEMPRKEHIYR